MESCTWFHIFLIAVIFGTQGIHDVRSQSYPPPVQVIDVFDYDADPLLLSACPLINMKSYLQKLADYVTTEILSYALVVVGPKSSGKSEGIQKMVGEWRKAGHIVIDINLKGRPFNVSSSQVLQGVAKQIYEFPIVKGEKLGCLRNHVIKNCSISVAVSQSYSFLLKVVSALGSIGIVSAFIQHLSNQNLSLEFLWKYYHVIGTVVVATALIFIYVPVMELVDPLHEKISAGDWETLSCVCNGIATCTPENRPILIVREFMNLNENSRIDLLRSFEQMKEKKVLFPSILETSDFMWYKDSPVVKSRASFKAYFLEEMTFEEGETELVDKYKMWKREEFTIIYEALGGHGGSYASLWGMINLEKMSIEEAIRSLKAESYANLLVCLRDIYDIPSDIKTVRALFCDMKLNDFKVNFDVPPKLIYHFASCNLLFIGADGEIYPQNHLLQHAISRYLDKFAVNCSNFTSF